MIMFAKVIGRFARWMDQYTENAYGAYLHARWPDKYMSADQVRKQTQR